MRTVDQFGSSAAIARAQAFAELSTFASINCKPWWTGQMPTVASARFRSSCIASKPETSHPGNAASIAPVT